MGKPWGMQVRGACMNYQSKIQHRQNSMMMQLTSLCYVAMLSREPDMSSLLAREDDSWNCTTSCAPPLRRGNSQTTLCQTPRSSGSWRMPALRQVAAIARGGM